MANENLHIDENTRWVLGGITNDANEEIRNLRVNPVTGRVLVEAVIASTNTAIGGTIPGGTPGSVLFIGPGSTLDQDNPNLFYDYTNFFLGLGTNTPDATLTVDGSVHFDLGGDATGDIFYRDAGGFLAPLGIGTVGQVLAVSGGIPSWVSAASLISGYNTIQDNGTPLTQRSTMNFVNYFDITDVASVTTININTAQLGADTTLISTLETNLDLANISGQINLATQVTGLLPPANIDITNLQSTLDLGSIAGQIDLATQVTGTLGLANGGTGASLSDPNYDAVWVWDDTTNTTRLANISGLTYNSGTNTLTASGGGTGTALETTVSQTGHGLSVGDVIKVSGTNTFAKAQGDSEVNSEAVGVVTTVVNANSFKYVSSAIQLAYAPVGTPGSAVWLDPTVAGGMTTTKPSITGQVARALGTIIESGVTMYFDIAALAEVIGNGGGAGSIGNGFQMMFSQLTSNSPSVSVTQQVWKFADYIFMQFGSGSDYSAWQLDSVTGSPYKSSFPITLSQTKSVSATPVMFISDDGTKLYYAYQNNLQDSGLGYVLVVDEFNTSFVNTNTYTYTYSAPPGQQIDLGDAFFVIGSNMYIYNGVTVHIGSALTQFTISGSTLTARTATTGGSNFKQTVWDGTNLWTINNTGTAFGKFTVSGTTLSSVAATFKYPTTAGNPDLFSGCDIGYGIGIFNGQFGVWQPSGYTYAICISSGPTNDYFEIVQATLRTYPKP